MTPIDSTLLALTITDTLGKINKEASRYMRGRIDAETFAERTCDLIVRCDELMKGKPSPH